MASHLGNLQYVAPLVGAWIEILLLLFRPRIAPSLLSWERGLKFDKNDEYKNICQSLLSWERGLKYLVYEVLSACGVAPLVGAWIEISGKTRLSTAPCRSSRGSVD